jgi:hypothetical protein
MREPITPALIRELWSKTYNKEGRPDWSHIFPYYHDQIVFEDSIQRVEGLEAFKTMCGRLAGRCEQLNMEIQSIAQEGDKILFDWVMTMMFNKYPNTPVYGCTRLTINESNQIVHQRDYFDLWGDIFNGIPYFHKPYRRFMRKHFG